MGELSFMVEDFLASYVTLIRRKKYFSWYFSIMKEDWFHFDKKKLEPRNNLPVWPDGQIIFQYLAI